MDKKTFAEILITRFIIFLYDNKEGFENPKKLDIDEMFDKHLTYRLEKHKMSKREVIDLVDLKINNVFDKVIWDYVDQGGMLITESSVSKILARLQTDYI